MSATTRQHREAQKRLSEWERLAKEQANLSAIGKARLEVEIYESNLEVLLSVHKDQGEHRDWVALATALPPHRPRRFSCHELKAAQRPEQQGVDEAHARDEQEFQNALRDYSMAAAEWARMRNFARRILAGESAAYKEALVEHSGLAEISALGSVIQFTIHSPKLIECGLKVNGRQAIPTEHKTLTSTGKLSVKPMPKARFHEIYQDYVCSCLLRVAREVLALLPIEHLLVTASVDMIDSAANDPVEQAVISAAISRTALGRLNFENLDPSDAIETFPRRGDAKASRRSGGFESVKPLTASDISQESMESHSFDTLVARVRQMREDLKTDIGNLESRETIAT